jgi:hypothetical protein
VLECGVVSCGAGQDATQQGALGFHSLRTAGSLSSCWLLKKDSSTWSCENCGVKVVIGKGLKLIRISGPHTPHSVDADNQKPFRKCDVQTRVI